ncbi:hypothetical protein HY500_03295 [Candidatus Woesearchaeota archaeon]|nr:hypothetical protein [Candidatus Woesearchaeota archaeon]
MADIKYFEENGKMYKTDSDGEKYRISFSEELQLKNLKATREHKKWTVMNFYASMILAGMLLALIILVVFVFYRLDKINFFTGILYR